MRLPTIDLQKYQPLYTPLAIVVGCLVIAVAIYGSGGMTITIGGKKEATGSPTVAGEEGTQGTTYDSVTLDRFAKCLTEKKAKLYTADWCPHCASQKKLFGTSVQYLDNIVCNKEQTDPWSEACKKAGITVVPTWIFKDGSQVSAVQTLEVLSEKTGCPLQ